MFRREKWWHREIERMRREHNAQIDGLLETISRLAGKPAPPPYISAPEPDDEDEEETDLVNPEYLTLP